MPRRQPLPESLHICLISRKSGLSDTAPSRSYLFPIAKGLASEGHKVDILTNEAPPHISATPWEGVRIHTLGSPRATQPEEAGRRLLAKFEELHKQSPFQLVHSLDANAVAIGQNRKRFRIAMTYDAECTQLSQIISILGMSEDRVTSYLYTGIAVAYKFLTTYLSHDRHILKTADGVFVTSPRHQVMLERYYLYPELKTYRVPYGVAPIDLDERERAEELRKRLRLPEKSKVIVTLSDMSEKSEMVHLLNAFQKVAIKKPSSRLIILGDGPRFKEIEYEMLSLALGSRVILTGAIKASEISDYISLADVFVNLSTHSTGFEPSLIEAMAQKKVIIGSEVNAIATVVEDSVDGFLIRPADTFELSNLLLSIFSEEIPIQEIGERARQKVVDLFDPTSLLQKTLDAYRQILNSTRFYRH